MHSSNSDHNHDEAEINRYQPQVLILPLPIQGHINPMLQFSKRLVSKGLKVTLITTLAIRDSFPTLPPWLDIELVPGNGDIIRGKESMDALLQNFITMIEKNLGDFLLGIQRDSSSSTSEPKFLVYDSIIPCALDIAQKLGLRAASFFTQSCAVSAIYYHCRHGSLKLPVEGNSVSLPSMPLLATDDLPSFISDIDSYPSILESVLERFSNFSNADFLLFNTFDKLEDEVVKWMKSRWPVKTIGPIIPSMYLDKRLEDDRDYGLSLFKPNIDACTEWLGSKETRSVVYISFGSMAVLSEEQMEELSYAIKNCDRNFLWIVRESEEKKLPIRFSAEASLSGKGLIVRWCNQLEVLAHPAIGCFITHSGWNSTLEALSLGVPMVVMPQWTDQPTNAKYVADVWRVGIRVRKDENGMTKREEIELRVREIMEGQMGKEIRRNALVSKELAKEAVDAGGSSDSSIQELVLEICKCSD